MTMNAQVLRQQTKFWLIVFAVFLLTLWVLRGILLPFVLGGVLAYFLDPVMERMASRGIPRGTAATVLLVFAGVVFLGVVAVLIPVLHAQAIEFAVAAPDLAQNLKTKTLPYIEGFYERLSTEDVEKLKAAAQEFSGKIVAWLGGVAKGMWSGGVALFDVISFLLITPVVVFYLLRDWQLLEDKVESWMPKPQKKTIKKLTGEINETLSGFMRGQAMVCLILGLFYGLALSFVGLKFGLVIGFFAGLLSFIPYVGSIVGGGTALAVALFQYGTSDWESIGIVAAIFVAGQILEGMVLSPKMIGDKVGLHPVWIIFALMAGGTLFGFVGVLIAIPVASVIGVLTRFTLKQYLDSPYYHGDKKPKKTSKKKR